MAHGQLALVLRHVRTLTGKHNPEQTDAQLLERFAADRDDSAFTTLVQRHGPMVWGVCRGVLGDRPDAEDAFQATFLVLVRRAGSFDRRLPVGGWLHRVAFRIAVKAKVQAVKRRVHEREALAVSNRDPQTEIEVQEQRAVLHEELHRLPDKYRIPLVLCHLEGKTHEQAARELGYAPGSMSWRLARARELLKQRLQTRGVTLSVAGLAVVLAQQSAAAVPGVLSSATIRAALLIAAGRAAAASGVSAQVAALMEGVLKALVLGKVKTALAVLLFLGAVGTSAGLLFQQDPGDQPAVAAKPQHALPGELRSAQTRPHVKEQPATRTDLSGDPLPAGALARLGTLRLRHGGVVWQTAFSPDSKNVAATSAAGIYFWDVATGKLVRRFADPEFGGYVVVFSPDGKALATTIRGRLSLVDSATGKLLRQFQGEREHLTLAAFSPDGKTLACWGSKIRLWDVATGNQRPALAGHPGQISAVAFSPDSKTLASAGWKDTAIRLSDVATGKEIRQLRGHKSDVLAVAYSPDGKIMASTGNDGTLRFWDVPTGKELRKAPGNGSSPIAFAPDGKTLATSGGDGAIVLWDPATAKQVRRLEKATKYLGFLTFSPDGKFLASMWNGISSFDLWDVATGKRLHVHNGHQDGVHAVAFSPDGQALASGSAANGMPEGVRLWDPHTGKELRRYGKHNSVYALAFSPDGETLASGSHPAIFLFDRKSGGQTGKLEGHGNSITSLAFSGDGRTLASRAQDKTIRVWDVPARKQVVRIDLTDEWVGRLALSPNGKIVASRGRQRESITLWDAGSGKELRQLHGQRSDDVVYSLAFSPDGKTLASGADTVRLWDVASGKELRNLTGHGQWIGFVAFSPDGRTLAAGSGDGIIRLWELATGQERCRFSGHEAAINAGAFSPEGKRLATGSEDTTILIWDLIGAIRSGQAGPPSRQQLEALWSALGANDAAKAYRALCTFAGAAQQAVPFFQERLRPVPVLDARQQKQLRQRIADLNSPRFAIRQQATEELEKLGELVVPALREAQQPNPPLEVRQRLQRLLEKLEGWTPERLRVLRAIEVLEQVDTIQSRQLLRQLSGGAAGALLTQEAKTALERLSKRSSQK